MSTIQIKHFFDAPTYTFTYLVFAKQGGNCVVIDPVLGFDHKSGRTNKGPLEGLFKAIEEHQLTVDWILETHAHADHLSGAQEIKSKFGGKVAIGNHITTVQNVFKGIFHLGDEFQPDGKVFDYLIAENETITCDGFEIQGLYVPGHTPACMAYKIENNIFVGDTMFLPDVGTARCDFPGGDAHTLYQSMQRILSYPLDTNLYMCHDYPPVGRSVNCKTTVREQKQSNIHVHDGISEEQFIQMRTARDKTLEMPLLILPAVQVNVRAGHFPPKESNGVSYLKIPLNAL